jgi:hypothetical protein
MFGMDLAAQFVEHGRVNKYSQRHTAYIASLGWLKHRLP